MSRSQRQSIVSFFLPFLSPLRFDFFRSWPDDFDRTGSRICSSCGLLKADDPKGWMGVVSCASWNPTTFKIPRFIVSTTDRSPFPPASASFRERTYRIKSIRNAEKISTLVTSSFDRMDENISINYNYSWHTNKPHNAKYPPRQQAACQWLRISNVDSAQQFLQAKNPIDQLAYAATAKFYRQSTNLWLGND